MNVLGLEIGWSNIFAGVALAGAFLIGVLMGTKWSKRPERKWPTPYPREDE